MSNQALSTIIYTWYRSSLGAVPLYVTCLSLQPLRTTFTSRSLSLGERAKEPSKCARDKCPAGSARDDSSRGMALPALCDTRLRPCAGLAANERSPLLERASKIASDDNAGSGTFAAAAPRSLPRHKRSLPTVANGDVFHSAVRTISSGHRATACLCPAKEQNDTIDPGRCLVFLSFMQFFYLFFFTASIRVVL